MSERLDEIFQIRRSIGDPVTGNFVYVDAFPDTAQRNTAYTTGDGKYQFFNGLEWREYNLKFGDAYIGLLVEKHGRLGASIKLVNNLIAQINPKEYITSGKAGGQSMSFPSLRDVLDYYNTLRDALLEEEASDAGMNSGLMLEAKRSPVGGVLKL